jgi:hypothetical protein
MSQVQPRVESHLLAALVAAVLFFPFGIPAVVYAARVDDRLREGDPAGARRASEQARLWSRLGLVFGVGSLLIVLVVWLFFSMKLEPTLPAIR